MLGIRAASAALIELASEKDEELAIRVLRATGGSYSNGKEPNQMLVSTTDVQPLKERGVKFRVLVDTSVGKASERRRRSA